MGDSRLEGVLSSGSISTIRAELEQGRLSVTDAVGWYLARIAASNRAGASLNAVRVLAPDAMQEASRAEIELRAGRARGPLHGIPFLVKDNVLTAGIPTAAGTAALAGFIPVRDATLVRRLRAAGAILLGKANMTELADYVSDVMPSEFSAAGGVVRNPHGNRYGRGQGSSVGSAAAVAAGLVPFAIGSETQNSLQTPACHSSVLAFKPTVGVVSRAGLVPLVPSQDSPGPLARNVQDAVTVLAAISGPDVRDSVTLDRRGQRRAVLARAPGQIRLGVPRRAIADGTELSTVMAVFERTLCALSRAGVVIIDPCDIPSAEQLNDVRSSVFRTEFKAAFEAFLDDHAHPCGISSLAALIDWNKEHPESIPYGQSLLVAAAETRGLSDATYLADRARDLALSRWAGIDAALRQADADLLIVPMSAAAKLTGKAGAPVVALPAGRDDSGSPFGVTLISTPGDDAALLSAAAAIELIVADRIIPAS